MALVNKTLSDVMSVTRTTGAQYWGQDGTLKTAAANEPRHEYDPNVIEAQNLLVNSETWWLSGYSLVNATVTEPGVICAPLHSELYRAVTQYGLLAPGVTYTVSAEVSKVTCSFFFGRANLGGYVKYNLDTGVVAETAGGWTGAITSLGNGVYRCAATFTGPSTSDAVVFGPWVVGSANMYGMPTAGGGAAVRVSKLQLNTGSTALPYTPTPAVFTGRATTGTHFGSDGNLRTAGVNELRLDYDPANPVQQNLLGHSEHLGASGYWGYYGAVVLSPNAAAAPDGSLSATRIQNTPGSNSFFGQLPYGSSAAVPLGKHTRSVFVKPDGSGNSVLIFEGVGGGGGAGGFLAFDAVAKTWAGDTVGNGFGTTYGYVDAGSGWLRVWVTMTKSTAAQIVNNSFYVGGYGSSAVQHGLYVWGFQFNSGTLLPYTPSTTTFTGRSTTGTYYDKTGTLQTAAAGVARYSYDPANLGAPPVLLLEPARTNLLLGSQDFTNGAWGRTGTTVTQNAGASPSGATNAASLAKNADGYANIAQAATISAGAVCTASVYFKAGSLTRGSITVISGTTDSRYWFDLTTGVVGGVFAAATAGYVSSGIVAVSGGWYRCWLTVTAQASTAVAYFYPDRGDSAVAGNVLIWGAQLELGSTPTSYIPTTTSQVTRAADTSTSVPFTRCAPKGNLLEPQRTNYVAQSEFVSGGHGGFYNTGNISGSLSRISPTGGTGIYKFTYDTAAAGGDRCQGNYYMPSGIVSASIFILKKIGGATFSLQIYNEPGGDGAVTFDTATGVATYVTTAVGSYSIESVGNYWRVKITNKIANVSGSNISIIKIYANSSNGGAPANGDTVEFVGAQLELGSYATSYIPTTAATVTRAADTTTSSAITRCAYKGLLIEGQRTNLIQNGQCIGASGTTYPTGHGRDQPYGGLEATALTTETLPSGMGCVRVRIAGTTTVLNRYLYAPAVSNMAVTAGTTYAAAVSYRLVAGQMPNTVYVQILWYDASAALVSMVEAVGPAVSGVEQRAVVTGTAPAGAVAARVRLDFNNQPAVGTAVDFSIQLGGFQFEAGPEATSYISTTTAQATRAADSYAISGSKASWLTGVGSGTFYFEFIRGSNAPGQKMVFMATDGTLNNRIGIYLDSATVHGTRMQVPSYYYGTHGGGGNSVLGAVSKCAVSFDGTVAKAFLNGVKLSESLGVPGITLTQLELGSQLGGGQLQGHIKTVRFFPDAACRTDAQLTTLTTP